MHVSCIHLRLTRNADNRRHINNLVRRNIPKLPAVMLTSRRPHRKIINRRVPYWYHEYMAMNLRVPEDLDRRLEKLAAEEHTSKSALLLQGAELVLQRHARRREISDGLDFVMSHDAELLTRLEDA